VGERGAVGVDRGAAERKLFELELPRRAQHLERAGHDLRADAVAGENDYTRGHRRRTLAAPRSEVLPPTGPGQLDRCGIGLSAGMPPPPGSEWIAAQKACRVASTVL